jgi:hypothetical protein
MLGGLDDASRGAVAWGGYRPLGPSRHLKFLVFRLHVVDHGIRRTECFLREESRLLVPYRKRADLLREVIRQVDDIDHGGILGVGFGRGRQHDLAKVLALDELEIW